MIFCYTRRPCSAIIRETSLCSRWRKNTQQHIQTRFGEGTTLEYSAQGFHQIPTKIASADGGHLEKKKTFLINMTKAHMNSLDWGSMHRACKGLHQAPYR